MKRSPRGDGRARRRSSARPARLLRLGLLCSLYACGPEATPSDPRKKGAAPASLRLEDASVYRVAKGETLSEIARRCRLAGGARALARWNRIADLDHVETGAALLVPHNSTCGRELPAARLPRFSFDGASCALPWASMPVGPTNAGAGKRRCVEPGRGYEICWQPWRSPGLEIRRDHELVHRDDEPTGDGGSGGGAPEFAWADLDGDGARELILTQLIGWSNGLSIPRTKILVFDQTAARPRRSQTAFYHREHWLKNEQRGCDVLQIEVRRLTGPVLGEGNYFVGVRLRWANQRFATAGRTFAAKRLRYRFFEDHRDAVWGGEPARRWLLDGQAEARPLAELRE